MSTNTFLQMFSTINASGELRLELIEKPIPTPGPDQVLVKIEATPINPSDQGVMFGRADISAAHTSGAGNQRMLIAPVPAQAMPAMKARVGQALAVGNEGAGTVVATGSSALAQSLAGKRVAVMGGSMYAQYRCVDAAACLPLLEGHTAKDGASCFVNPLTALSMIETMKMEGHTALVHTAAASNLGQMLVRICQDGRC
jgi:NADPH:quinone reductase